VDLRLLVGQKLPSIGMQKDKEIDAAAKKLVQAGPEKEEVFHRVRSPDQDSSQGNNSE
jgi:hypothetical protein